MAYLYTLLTRKKHLVKITYIKDNQAHKLQYKKLTHTNKMFILAELTIEDVSKTQPNLMFKKIIFFLLRAHKTNEQIEIF